MRWYSRRSASPADFFGKTRLMNVCVLVVALSALVCAVATSFSLLVAMRVVAGMVAGGVFPVAMALIGDLVPIHQRQVAIARLLAVALTANRAGGLDRRHHRRPARLARRVRRARACSGWSPQSLLSSPSAASRRRPRRSTAPPWSRISAASSPTRAPRSASSSVFLEAIFIHGLFPYVAVLLLAPARPRASIAGLLIAALRSAAFSIPGHSVADRAEPERHLMLVGGAIAATRVSADRAAFPLAGTACDLRGLRLGFYLLHSCIQVHVTDLSSPRAARPHRCILFLLSRPGDRPVVYGIGFAHGGPEPTLLAGARWC